MQAIIEKEELLKIINSALPNESHLRFLLNKAPDSDGYELRAHPCEKDGSYKRSEDDPEMQYIYIYIS